MLNLKIYSRKDCHLCDIAKEELNDLQNEIEFSITETDIDKDRDAFEKYKYLIPVIEMDGKIMCTGSIDREKLKKALTSRP